MYNKLHGKHVGLYEITLNGRVKIKEKSWEG